MGVDESFKVAARELFVLLSDREWHDIYELHASYRVSPVVALDVVSLFLKNSLIVRERGRVKLSDGLDIRRLALLNFLCKTRRPDALDYFSPNRLTGRRWRV